MRYYLGGAYAYVYRLFLCRITTFFITTTTTTLKQK